jgi:lysophospholipase L1-like esterase
MKNKLREELEAMKNLQTGDSFTAEHVHTLVDGILEGGEFKYVNYDSTSFPYPQTIGSTANSIVGLGNADETMIDTIFIMPNKSSNPDATLMIVVDEKDPSTDPKTYQYVYVGNINNLPSDVLTESSIVNDLSTGGTSKPLSAEQGRTLNSHVNYVTCGSGASDQVKLISDDGFELSTHLRLLVMMNNINTHATPKFNINNTGIKDVWYNGVVASDTNTWSAGEILDVYYDGIKYIANTHGGAQFSTGEKVGDVGIDDKPTAGSENLVKSGGVQNELALGAVYDVSAKNPTGGPNNDGKWKSLATLLADADINTLIPIAVRKGGMSIKFIQNSDNKYVQYRLMHTLDNASTAAADFANTANWQGVISTLITGSKDVVESNTIAKAINGAGIKCKFSEFSKYIDYNTGEIIAAASSSYGILRIDVSPGDKLIVYTNITFPSSASIAFYNGTVYNKTVSYPYGSRNGIFTVPNDVDNVIICGGPSNISSYFAYVRSKDTQDLVDDLKNLISASESFTISRTTYNLVPFDKSGYVNNTNGNIVSGDGWYNEFKVNKNDDVYVKTLNNSGAVASVAMYNGDTYNSQLTITGNIDRRITIPENVTKIRVSFFSTESKEGYGVRIIPATDVAGVEDMIQSANTAISVTIPTTYGWFNNAQVGETLTIASTGSAYSNAIYDIREYLNISKKITVYYKFGQDKKYQENSYTNYLPVIAILDSAKKVLYRTSTFVNSSVVDFSDYPTAFYLAICVSSSLTPIGFEISTKDIVLPLLSSVNGLISDVSLLEDYVKNHDYSFSDFTKSRIVNLNGIVSSASSSFGILEIKTCKDLYLDINVKCGYGDAYVIAFYKNNVFLSDISVKSNSGQVHKEIVCPNTDVYDKIILTSDSYTEGITKIIQCLYALKKDVIIERDNYYFANLPTYQDCVIGRDNYMYLDNIGRYYKDTANEFTLHFLGNTPSGLVYTNDVIKYTPNSQSVNFDVYFEKYKNIETLLSIKKLTFRPIPKSIPDTPTDKTILIIGDSLIDSGDASSIVYDYLVADGDINPILLGDHGTGNKVNMGHSSWSWDTWTNPEYENTPIHGRVNPFFYNGELDFAHFMQQNYPNLSTIDYVIISLGTNDMGQDGTLSFDEYQKRANAAVEKAKYFMTALLRDYQNCKIALGIPSAGAFTSNAGYNFYPTGFRNAILAYAYAFNSEFDNGIWNSNVTCVYHGWFTNPYEDYPHNDITLPSGEKTRQITNFIHPSTIGYQHWGIGYYNKIRAFIAGLL